MKPAGSTLMEEDDMEYKATQDRYDKMEYRRSGLRVGSSFPRYRSECVWLQFRRHECVFEQSRYDAPRAFDLGITHFDLANNYGPVAGSAEETLSGDHGLKAYRD